MNEVDPESSGETERILAAKDFFGSVLHRLNLAQRSHERSEYKKEQVIEVA